ncbi:MAG: tripartite tricarboxylate transporter TctB family protein [Oscillibacter sp.]|nr:tripartite tricarboxylate transporter TctB family protein [Oscillibacter sp.]
MKKTDIGVVAFIYAVCLLFLVMTLRLPSAAQTYPLFIIILLSALTTLYVAQMALAAKKSGITSGLEDFEGFLPKQFFPILGMVVVYLVIMYFAGFYIATLLFMAACLLFLKVPKWQILLSTAVILVLVYCAFTLFLKVKLPMGLLFK